MSVLSLSISESPSSSLSVWEGEKITKGTRAAAVAVGALSSCSSVYLRKAFVNNDRVPYEVSLGLSPFPFDSLSYS